jgi:hypothetical protein
MVKVPHHSVKGAWVLFNFQVLLLHEKSFNFMHTHSLATLFIKGGYVGNNPCTFVWFLPCFSKIIPLFVKRNSICSQILFNNSKKHDPLRGQWSIYSSVLSMTSTFFALRFISFLSDPKACTKLWEICKRFVFLSVLKRTF